MDLRRNPRRKTVFQRYYTYDPPASKSTGPRKAARRLLWITALIGLPMGILWMSWLVTLPDVELLAHTNPTSTALMNTREAQAKERGRTIGRHWVWVPLSRISPHLRHAVVAAEDASFFTHKGFDWESIRAAARRNLEAGELKRGGSTITQQLAKNLYLSPERSFRRKMREALITRSLEQHLTKKRILELYLNVAEWGKGVYGVEAAARHHFQKSSHDLTADEAAWLAAILPSPRRYDPLRKTPFLTRRHDRIRQWIDRHPAHATSIVDE